MNDDLPGRVYVVSGTRFYRIRAELGSLVGVVDDLGNPFASAAAGAFRQPVMEMPEMDIRPEAQAATPAVGGPSQADVEEAAVALQEHEQAQATPVARRAPQSTMATAPAPVDHRDEDELYDANEADRRSRFTAGMELAGRQLVGAITRTPVGQSIGAAPSAVPGAQQAIKSRSEKAAEILRRQREGRIDDRNDRAAMSEEELRRAKIAALLNGNGKTDPKAGNDASLRELLLSPAYSGALTEKGVTPETVAKLTGKGLEDLVAQLRTDTTNEATVAAGRASSAIAAVRSEEYRRRAKEAEDARKAAEGMPPGVESINNNATDKDKEALKLALEGHADLKRLTAEYRAVLGKAKGMGGLERMTGDYRRQLDRIQSEMTIAAKNAGGLGQITAGDQGLIDSIRPDATTPWSVFRDQQSFETQLKGLENWAENKVHAGMEARGFRRSATKGQPAPGGTVNVRRTKDGVTKPVSAATAAALAKKGGYEVVP